jgi:hypothetical protein
VGAGDHGGAMKVDLTMLIFTAAIIAIGFALRWLQLWIERR